MLPNLQGLNVFLPAQTQNNSQDLLSGQSYPDLASAQLDLWADLTFNSDEHLRSAYEDKYRRKSLEAGEEEGANSPATRENATHDGHVDAATRTNLCNNQPTTERSIIHPSHQPFDSNPFLAGFGIDAFAVPPPLQQSAAPRAPSRAQITTLYGPSDPELSSAVPPLISPYSTTTTDGTRSASISRPPAPPSVSDDGYPTTKRSRARSKASIPSTNSPADYGEDPPSASGSSISGSDEKRRRNTAASVRFRLKKKEREAALESEEKKLTTKVTDLERECEELRRENGWLKGLIVGDPNTASVPVDAAPPETAGLPGAESNHPMDTMDSV